MRRCSRTVMMQVTIILILSDYWDSLRHSHDYTIQYRPKRHVKLIDYTVSVLIFRDTFGQRKCQSHIKFNWLISFTFSCGFSMDINKRHILFSHPCARKPHRPTFFCPKWSLDISKTAKLSSVWHGTNNLWFIWMLWNVNTGPIFPFLLTFRLACPQSLACRLWKPKSRGPGNISETFLWWGPESWWTGLLQGKFTCHSLSLSYFSLPHSTTKQRELQYNDRQYVSSCQCTGWTKSPHEGHRKRCQCSSSTNWARWYEKNVRFWGFVMFKSSRITEKSVLWNAAAFRQKRPLASNSLEKNHQGFSAKEGEHVQLMYATCSDKCPVASLKLYLSKLNKDCEALFQRPRTVSWKSAESWYGCQPVGIN